MKPVPTPQSYFAFRELVSMLRSYGVRGAIVSYGRADGDADAFFFTCRANGRPRHHHNDNAPEAA